MQVVELFLWWKICGKVGKRHVSLVVYNPLLIYEAIIPDVHSRTLVEDLITWEPTMLHYSVL